MILEKVIKILSDQLGIDEAQIEKDTDIMETLGADSLDIVEMIMTIEEEFGVTISDEVVSGFKTVGDVAAYLEENI
ncbi:MAG: acyl carrier protein [Oscillospiraceae bacterium]|nr:acyl carrier protein [Oscillospiraceae bacterium]